MYNPKYIYVEGGRRTYRLTPEGEQMFRSRFPITPAKDIAHELGCGIDMVYKLANSYGVKKDPTYKCETLRSAMLHARAYYVIDKKEGKTRTLQGALQGAGETPPPPTTHGRTPHHEWPGAAPQLLLRPRA